jgi:peptide/nickel transport system substrate-binding protein
LREARWADGRPVDAPTVARLLARQVRRGGRNPLSPFLTAIESVVAMTPQVIEVRLARPRPDLLKLFAQPELALVRPDPVVGSGPLMIAAGGTTALLRPVPDIDMEGDNAQRSAPDIRLVGERAARAIARFAAGRADLVTGGTFADWPLVAAAGILPTAIGLDPAAGLFGLAITRRDGFLADAANRAAVAQAIDRSQVTAAVAVGLEPAETLLPVSTEATAAPVATPTWALPTMDERRSAARARVQAWTGGPVILRIALPQGPGATRLWGGLAASLRRVGIEARRVALDEPAELQLVDAVAPYDDPRWYLASACRPCGAEADERLEAARIANTLAERAARSAEADAALTADVAFIPLARPLRWSLVAPGLTAWAPNARAWHPLNHLRLPPT